MEALPNIKGEIEHVDGGTLRARTAVTRFSFGERILVHVQDSGNWTSLTVISKPLWQFTTNDEGMNFQNTALISATSNSIVNGDPSNRRNWREHWVNSRAGIE
jgi:hypothetical protein